MTTRVRGWTIAALVVAVAVLVSSVAWTASWASSGAGAAVRRAGPAHLGADRGVAGQRGPTSDLAGEVVDVVAADMGGRGWAAVSAAGWAAG